MISVHRLKQYVKKNSKSNYKNKSQWLPTGITAFIRKDILGEELDIYVTSVDYDTSAEVSTLFFKTV